MWSKRKLQNVKQSEYFGKNTLANGKQAGFLKASTAVKTISNYTAFYTGERGSEPRGNLASHW